MRAIYIKNLQDYTPGGLINYEGDFLHHLQNVVRVKLDDEVLALDGQGCSGICRVKKIAKKSVEFHLVSLNKNQKREKTCAVSKIKRDSLTLAIKNCVELGVTKIHIVNTEYSQNFPINLEKLHKVAISSLLQSNNLFLPEILIEDNFDLFVQNHSNSLIVMDNRTKSSKKEESSKFNEKMLFVGPEAGFSDSERNLFTKYDVSTFSLSCPIMRAETAIVAGLSFLHFNY